MNGSAVYRKHACLLLLAWPACAYGQEQVPIRAAGGPGAATEMQAEIECSAVEPGTTLAILSWKAAKRRGSDQRVDVTMYRGGFERREYSPAWQQARDTAPVQYAYDKKKDRYTVRITGLAAGVNYYWRVLNLEDDGWVPSTVARVLAPVCPVDMLPDNATPRASDEP